MPDLECCSGALFMVEGKGVSDSGGGGVLPPFRLPRRHVRGSYTYTTHRAQHGLRLDRLGTAAFRQYV